MERVGRYRLYGEIGAGGMAAVHLGRLVDPSGFARTVAIKRLFPQLARDPDFVAMFFDEARLASRVSHPNVVGVIDVVREGDAVMLVMDYVEGETLARLLRADRAQPRPLPPSVASAIVTGALYGLHAAHEATQPDGSPLALVHRDVSPQNVIVGADGVARVLDFGVARAAVRSQVTREGQLKGKLPYMPPEQLLAEVVDRRLDVWAAGVVLWEVLTGRRLFAGDSEGAIVQRIVEGHVPAASELVPDLPPEVDDVIARALARDPDDRFPTAWAFAVALERALAPAPPRFVAELVRSRAGEAIARRAAQVRAAEREAIDEPTAAFAAESRTDPSRAPAPSREPEPSASESLRDRRVLPALVVMALLGAMTAVAIAGWLRAPGDATPAPSPSTRATIAAVPSSAPTVEVFDLDAIAPLPARSAAPDARAMDRAMTTPSKRVNSEPAPAASATHVAPSASPKRMAGGDATGSTPAPASCSPPFVVENGIRRIKRECVR